MPEETTPERVTNRVITEASGTERIEIGGADLKYVDLAVGDDVKVVTYDSHIEIIPQNNA
jgi:hypothetical protein